MSGVDPTVPSGEQWALLGPDGAGRTTVLSLCGAPVHPTAGTVDVLGQRLGRVELRALRRRIGHVDPRHAPLSPPTVLATVVVIHRDGEPGDHPVVVTRHDGRRSARPGRRRPDDQA